MSDAGRPPATDPRRNEVAERLRWDDGLTRARSGRDLLHSPLRLSLAIGALIMFVGALMPWAEGLIGYLPVRFGGFDGAADGLILAAFAIVALLFARSRDFLDAPDGARRWAPLLLGLACVGIWVLGFQAAQITIQHWQDDDGHGSIAIGYWVAGLGVWIVAIVGAYATLRYHEGQTTDPTALLRLPRRSDLTPIATAIGAVVGLVGGALLAVSIVPPAAASAPMLFMGTIGLVVGGYAGRAVGRFVQGLLGA
jgi:hypothetical protein